MRAFLCHSTQHSQFVIAVGNELRRSFDNGVFFYEEHQDEPSFVRTIDDELGRCQVIVVFAELKLTDWQSKEVNSAHALGKGFIICQLGSQLPDKGLNLLSDCPRIMTQPSLLNARAVALKITKCLKIPFDDGSGLPANPHIFSYEKDIISHFIDCLRHPEENLPPLLRDKQLQGCPREWPKVWRWSGEDLKQENPGAEEPEVVAAALSKYHRGGSEANIECLMLKGLSFPEAVRRQKLHFPLRNGLKVGIVVSGGIAPGINAVVDGIVQRHELYAEEGGWRNSLSVEGLKNGFLAFDDLPNNSERLDKIKSSQNATEGGSFLGTSRDDQLIAGEGRKARFLRILGQLSYSRYDILYVIGGDGSMKAAHALWTIGKEEWQEGRMRPLSIVAVPKTMDNDILWVWQAFGFMSAVEKAREIIATLSTEMESNPRLGVVQLFGSDSGFVVSHAVLASRSGRCDLALIPENEFSMTNIAKHLREKMRTRARNSKDIIPRGLVVMAETAIPTDALNYIDDPDIGLSQNELGAIKQFCANRLGGQRIQGQTNDYLRSAGLKIVSVGLRKLLQSTQPEQGDPDWNRLRDFTNEPRHLLRAIPPSCTDIIFGNRLGTLAVDNAMAGYTDFMISQWLTEYVLVPLQLVVLGRKRIPEAGMFWKSVIAKTGQPVCLNDSPEQ